MIHYSCHREYHGIYIHIGEGSYFKVGGGRDLKSKYIKCKRRGGDVLSRRGTRTSPLSRGGGGAVALCPLSFVSPNSRQLLDHAPSSQQSEPFGVSPRGLLQPKLGQQNNDGASVPGDMPDVIMTLVSYFCGLPGVPRKARKFGTISARFPPQSHNLLKQYDGQVRRQRRRWHVYLQVQMCWEREKGSPFRINISIL